MKPNCPRDVEFPIPTDPTAPVIPLPGEDGLLADVDPTIDPDPGAIDSTTDPLPIDELFPEDLDPEEIEDAQAYDVETSGLTQGETRLAGHVDTFLGRVVAVYYGSGSEHGVEDSSQTIDIERVDAYWDGTTNITDTSLVASPGIGGFPAISAKPFPLRSDQPRYLVQVNDVVTVLQGGDGRHWYLADDLPFIGTVVVWDKANQEEAYEGGAGSGTNDGVKVRQQIMSGDPLTETVTFADKEISSAAWADATAYVVDDVVVDEGTDYRCIKAHTSDAGTIETDDTDYWDADSNITIQRYVNVLTTAGQGNGYRVGDKVLVVRRGLYLFAVPGAQSFLADIADEGPGEEADFANSHYWVIEQVGSITVSGNAWTGSIEDRSGTGPDGEGSVARYVDALNLAESGTHDLSTGTVVMVTCWQDAGDHFYTFSHAAPVTGTDRYVAVSSGDSSPGYLETKIQTDDAWLKGEGDNATDEDYDLIHEIPPNDAPRYGPITSSGYDKFCAPIAICDARGHVLGWFGMCEGVYAGAGGAGVEWYSPWGYSAPSIPGSGFDQTHS